MTTSSSSPASDLTSLLCFLALCLPGYCPDTNSCLAGLVLPRTPVDSCKKQPHEKRRKRKLDPDDDPTKKRSRLCTLPVVVDTLAGHPLYSGTLPLPSSTVAVLAGPVGAALGVSAHRVRFALGGDVLDPSTLLQDCTRDGNGVLRLVAAAKPFPTGSITSGDMGSVACGRDELYVVVRGDALYACTPGGPKTKISGLNTHPWVRNCMEDVAFSAVRNQLYVMWSSTDDKVSVCVYTLDGYDAKLLAQYFVDPESTELYVDPDGRHLLTDTGTLLVFDDRTGVGVSGGQVRTPAKLSEDGVSFSMHGPVVTAFSVSHGKAWLHSLCHGDPESTPVSDGGFYGSAVALFPTSATTFGTTQCSDNDKGEYVLKVTVRDCKSGELRSTSNFPSICDVSPGSFPQVYPTGGEGQVILVLGDQVRLGDTRTMQWLWSSELDPVSVNRVNEVEVCRRENVVVVCSLKQITVLNLTTGQR